MPKPPPHFPDLLDRAVLSPAQQLELTMLALIDPVRAGIKIGSIIAGQQLACRIAAEEAING